MIGIGRFVLFFTGFSLLVFGMAMGLSSLFKDTVILSPNFIPIFIFLFFLTIIVYFLGLWGMKKGAEYSVYSILGGSLLR